MGRGIKNNSKEKRVDHSVVVHSPLGSLVFRSCFTETRVPGDLERDLKETHWFLLSRKPSVEEPRGKDTECNTEQAAGTGCLWHGPE